MIATYEIKELCDGKWLLCWAGGFPFIGEFSSVIEAEAGLRRVIEAKKFLYDKEGNRISDGPSTPSHAGFVLQGEPTGAEYAAKINKSPLE